MSVIFLHIFSYLLIPSIHSLCGLFKIIFAINLPPQGIKAPVLTRYITPTRRRRSRIHTYGKNKKTSHTSKNCSEYSQVGNHIKLGGIAVFAVTGLTSDASLGSVSIAGLTTSMIGLCVLPIVLIFQPRLNELGYLHLREELLIEGESDFDQLINGVDKWNKSIRKKCSH